MTKKYKIKYTDGKIISLLYQITCDATRIFEQYAIAYWAIGGTFLGLIRSRGILVNDDDVDLGMMNTDVDRFLALEPLFNKCGYNIVKVWLGYKIFYANRPLSGRHKYSFPNIDIFVMKEDLNKKKVIYAPIKAREMWSKEYFHMDELYPLQKYEFGDFEIYGPNLHQDYFDRAYGKDWDEITYRDYDHEKEEVIEKVKVKLTKFDRQPAQPTKVNYHTLIKDNNKPLEINNKVVVSMTTIPSRIEFIYKTVKNIMKQTQYIDKIYVNIPHVSLKGVEYEIPDKLYNLAKHSKGQLILNRKCNDIGPGTKLYPTLKRERNPNTFIITIDDDEVYDKHMIEHLVKAYMKNPYTAFGYEGWNIGKNGRMKDLGSIKAGEDIDILEGFAGVLYCRKFFMKISKGKWVDQIDKFVRMRKGVKECIFVDDVYISAWLAMNNITRTLLDPPNNYEEPYSHSGSDDALSGNPEVAKRNAKCAVHFLKYFR